MGQCPSKKICHQRCAMKSHWPSMWTLARAVRAMSTGLSRLSVKGDRTGLCTQRVRTAVVETHCMHLQMH